MVGYHGDERSFYLTQVKPVLETGMAELTCAEAQKIGCYFNRYMTLTDASDAAAEKTYSVSAWRSMSDLEHWVRGATHLSIFASGIENYRRAGGRSMLRPYHELSVLHAVDQTYRYINCHPQTGMLMAASSTGQPESVSAPG